jgi:hypothetical protein
MRSKPREEVTSIDLLVDGFEKNEVFGGFHWRELPMADVAAAERKFAALFEELRRWKGSPASMREDSSTRVATWSDVELRQCGRGVLLRIVAPRFDWWNEDATWTDDPMGTVVQSLADERSKT